MILFQNGASPQPCQLCPQMKLLCSIFAKRYFGNIFKNPLLYNISYRLPLLCIHSQFDNVYFDFPKKKFFGLIPLWNWGLHIEYVFVSIPLSRFSYHILHSWFRKLCSVYCIIWSKLIMLVFVFEFFEKLQEY